MVFRPDGSPNWSMVLALSAALSLVGSAIWWGASLSSTAASQQLQINNIQSNFNNKMSSIQVTLTGQETLIQNESIELSKLGQKLDDLQAVLAGKIIKTGP
jgi:hypothetical protein